MPESVTAEVSEQVITPLQKPLTAFVVFKDDESGNFDIDDWLEELSAKPNGIYVKNAQAFVVSRIGESDELQAFRNIRAKANAIQILREHYPDLPAKIENMTIRQRVILDDGVVISVALAEIVSQLKKQPNCD